MVGRTEGWKAPQGIPTNLPHQQALSPRPETRKEKPGGKFNEMQLEDRTKNPRNPHRLMRREEGREAENGGMKGICTSVDELWK